MFSKLSDSTIELVEKAIENIKNGTDRSVFIVIDDACGNPVCGIYPEQKLVVVGVVDDGRVNLDNYDRISAITLAHGWFVAPATNVYSAISENEAQREVHNFIKLYVDKAIKLAVSAASKATRHPDGARLGAVFELYELAAIRDCAHAFVANVGLDGAHEYIDAKMVATQYIAPRACECVAKEIMKAAGF